MTGRQFGKNYRFAVGDDLPSIITQDESISTEAGKSFTIIDSEYNSERAAVVFTLKNDAYDERFQVAIPKTIFDSMTDREVREMLKAEVLRIDWESKNKPYYRDNKTPFPNPNNLQAFVSTPDGSKYYVSPSAVVGPIEIRPDEEIRLIKPGGETETVRYDGETYAPGNPIRFKPDNKKKNSMTKSKKPLKSSGKRDIQL